MTFTIDDFLKLFFLHCASVSSFDVTILVRNRKWWNTSQNTMIFISFWFNLNDNNIYLHIYISILKSDLKISPSKASSKSLFIGPWSDMAFFTVYIPGERIEFNVVVRDVYFDNAIWIEGLQKIWSIFPKLSKVKLPEFAI